MSKTQAWLTLGAIVGGIALVRVVKQDWFGVLLFLAALTYLHAKDPERPARWATYRRYHAIFARLAASLTLAFVPGVTVYRFGWHGWTVAVGIVSLLALGVCVLAIMRMVDQEIATGDRSA